MRQEPIDLLMKKENNGNFSVEMHAIIDRQTQNETFHIYLNEGWREIIYTRVYSEHNAELLYNHYKTCIDTIVNLNGKSATNEGGRSANTTNSCLHNASYKSRHR